MSNSELPDRASSEHLTMQAKERESPTLDAFFAACAAGDLAVLRTLIDRDPALVRARNRNGATGLHLAVRHPDALRLLLERGADPNARDVGDNALPIHGAAGEGSLDSVRALLDAGSDVHGVGDVHRLEVVGWATVFAEAHREVVDLLVERGARHHVFSAIALGDRDLLRRVVEGDPGAIARRLSRFEQEQTALHYVVAPADGLVGGLFRTGDHYRTLDLLIGLGAELDAEDAKGRTPLLVAMLRGDGEAMRRLRAAGATAPALRTEMSRPTMSELAASARSLSPMLGVPDMHATVAWYQSIGFTLAGSDEQDGKMGWASVTFGNAEVMFVPSAVPRPEGTSGLSLWIRTSRLDDLHALLVQRQLERASAALAAGATDVLERRFTQDLHTAFYGQREFCIRDPNGVELCFYEPVRTAE